MVVAPLSGKIRLVYGLRVIPSFDEALGTYQKKYKIPIPDRRARWYANSVYRSYILDAAEKLQSQEEESLEYKKLGYEAPEAAARVVQKAQSMQDPAFARMQAHSDRMDAHDSYERAFDIMNHEHSQEDAHSRHEFLGRTYGSNRGDPMIELHHEQLDESQIHHYMPAPRPQPARSSSWRAPPLAYSREGQPQAAEFRTFEELNLGGSHRVGARHLLSPEASADYERMREDAAMRPKW